MPKIDRAKKAERIAERAARKLPHQFDRARELVAEARSFLTLGEAEAAEPSAQEAAPAEPGAAPP